MEFRLKTDSWIGGFNYVTSPKIKEDLRCNGTSITSSAPMYAAMLVSHQLLVSV